MNFHSEKSITVVISHPYPAYATPFIVYRLTPPWALANDTKDTAADTAETKVFILIVGARGR